MFSENLKKYVGEKLEERKSYFPKITDRLDEIKNLPSDQKLLMEFLYAVMPLRDLGEYDTDIFLDYVRHSLWLYQNIEWCKELPEDIFLNHVLYYRINTENIVRNRSFLYEMIKDRIAGKGLEEAVIELNYFCAESLTYQTTDHRTMSPIAAYFSGYGRCGEESTFAVSVFRSAGIAARQVYTPWWAHCDDNHAWVEVFVNGRWQYLGACEPEEVLNRGWFSAASSRAMMVHSRVFSDYQTESFEECMGVDGCLSFYNNTSLYAPVKRLTIKVTEEGRAVGGAKLTFEILNMAQFGKISTLKTDSMGEASLYLGFGDVAVRAEKGELFGEVFVKAEEEYKEISLLPWEEERILTDTWVEFDFFAPTDHPDKAAGISREQKKLGKIKQRAAAEKREKRIEHYFDKEKADKYPEALTFFRSAKGNFEEVYRFLSKDTNPNRFKLLKTLSKKDFIDLKADILEDHLVEKDETLSDEMFEKYVLSPRLYNEEMTAYKSFIKNFFSEEEKSEFLKNPFLIRDYIDKNITYHREYDYVSITSTPIGTLRKKEGNILSKKMLFVAICRALLLPARINKITVEAEVYRNGNFIPVGMEKTDAASPEERDFGTLRLKVEEGGKWNYYNTYTLGKLSGHHFVTLDYENLTFHENELELTLPEGIYRLISTSRMPNGNQKSAYLVFRIRKGEEVLLELKEKEAELSDMLVHNEIADFEVKDESNKAKDLGEIVGKGTSLLAFLEEGSEPTEHVLNEMLERTSLLNAFSGKIIFVLNGKESLKNATLENTLKKIPKIEVYYDENLENAEPLARRMYVNPEKLPLLVLLKEGLIGVYACSGYNVGSVDLILRMV